jgi:hypothetical protein
VAHEQKRCLTKIGRRVLELYKAIEVSEPTISAHHVMTIGGQVTRPKLGDDLDIGWDRVDTNAHLHMTKVTSAAQPN